MSALKDYQLPCGCVDPVKVNATSGLHGQTCLDHTLDRFVVAKEGAAVGPHREWYDQHVCPCCGRVNDTGLACPESWTVSCPECGLHTCCSLRMGHYHLERQTGLICPSTTHKHGKKPRTIIEKRRAALIAADLSRNAKLQDFPGKRRSDDHAACH